jgi:hypothetical protein
LRSKEAIRKERRKKEAKKRTRNGKIFVFHFNFFTVYIIYILYIIYIYQNYKRTNVQKLNAFSSIRFENRRFSKSKIFDIKDFRYQRFSKLKYYLKAQKHLLF